MTAIDGGLWLPRSGCGPDCLRGEAAPVAGRLRRGIRLAALAGVLLGAIALVPALPILPVRRREPLVRACARGVLRALGLDWAVRGRLPSRRALVVANHVSWLDIVALLAAGGTRLVAKTEVRRWPLVGRIAAATGAIFLDRARPTRLPAAVDEVRVALAAGAVVAVFPEGTTSCGAGAGGFRPAFFQAAIDTGAAVVPLTLSFRAAGTPTARPAFIGDETLLDSLRRVLAVRRLSIGLSVGSAIHPAPAASRRSVAWIAGIAVGCAPPERIRSSAPPIPFPAVPVAGPADLRHAA